MNERDIVDELREIQRMNTTLHGAQMAARAADEIERLRAERDEARRKISHLMGGTVEQEWFANRMGWDCFKEKP